MSPSCHTLGCAQGNIGRVLIGKVHESGAVDLAEPEQFTEGNEPAFDPMIAGTTNNRLALSREASVQ